MASVDITDLGSELSAIVGDYVDEVERAAEEDVRAAADVAVSELRATSPKRKGRYASGWASEPDAEDMSGKAYRVFNKTKPGLTHLLEKGHGGPHPAPAHPHIAAAAEKGASELERRISGG